MKVREGIYYTSIISIIWFEYIVVISFLFMFMSYKDKKARLIHTLLLIVLFFILRRDLELLNKLIITVLAMGMLTYQPLKKWRSNHRHQ